MQCILIGSESLLAQCGDILLARGWSIAAVVSENPRITEWADTANIPVYPLDQLPNVASGTEFDWLFSITHLRIVPTAVLQHARRGAVNFHDGPLPKYGGLYATAWALHNGETSHGVTWHRMTEKVDQGEILVQQHFPIGEEETALSLNARCWEAAIDSFPNVLDRLLESLAEKTRSDTPSQPLDTSTFHRLVERPIGHGQLDPSQTVDQWARIVRTADTGPYANPFITPWLLVGKQALVPQRVSAPTPSESPTHMVVGTVVAATVDTLTLRVADGVVHLEGIRQLDGSPSNVLVALRDAELSIGAPLPRVDAQRLLQRDATLRAAVQAESSWVRALEVVVPVELPGTGAGAMDDVATGTRREFVGAIETTNSAATGGNPVDDAGQQILSLLAIFLLRTALRRAGDILVTTPTLRETSALGAPLLSTKVPWRIEWDANATVADALDRQTQTLRSLEQRGPYQRSVHQRYPHIARQSLTINELPIAVHLETAETSIANGVTITVSDSGQRMHWECADARLTTGDLEQLHTRFQSFVDAALQTPAQRLNDIPLLDAKEQQQLLAWGTGPAVVLDDADTIHRLIEHQATVTPDRVAVIADGTALTYAELISRSGLVAQQLIALHVVPDDRVALSCDRSVDLLIGLLGILRAGAAYVPLDPHYPADRLRLMFGDCGASILVTQQRLADTLDLSPRHRILVDGLGADASHASVPAIGHGSNLAYVSYTSGSTGRPKGVMVEHRQVINLFAGMDRVLGATPSVWLAVTSMSFDISVLELCWTLARGYTVVLSPGREQTATVKAAPRHVGFSLFYFSADEQENATDKYRVLLEGARFADTHDFEAVWTPERHFHAFGGLYPNPSVTSAAIAAITTRVGIRAGSCVLPIHHPARVVEEWSVVDNLSAGRVGISFAAGWQPNDFVFRPESFADAKTSMFRDVEIVRRLWRGESITFPGPKGDIAVRTLPRPVQAELPVWITTAGNPDTFVQAGRAGGNILTHLLGQTVEELAPKLAAYRAARKAAGHPGDGRVTLMLHTFVGDDDAQVRETVRKPMTEYLRTSIGLIKQYAGVFPTLRQRPGSDGSDIDFATLSDEEMEGLLAFSFERYYSTSALFGTVETCQSTVERVREIGVDEIACLIDFGLPSDVILSHLPQLDRLRLAAQIQTAATDQPEPVESSDVSLATLIDRYNVTHMQCTPSMARLLLAAPDTRTALGQLDVMCVGGEALPAVLATDLQAARSGRLLNMYGPTETTIWSTVHGVSEGETPIPLGRAITNTTLRVVDPETAQLLPIGTPGELLIGGLGVTRGYLDRPDLTLERFINVADNGELPARYYRTGDLVQWRVDGSLHFLGRLDNQVKVRGYRIELGEIEACIASDPAVQEVAVIVKDDGTGDPRLIAYLTERQASNVVKPELRKQLQAALPDFMVPSQFVVLPDMPRTPNLKIDRKALMNLRAPNRAPARVNTTPKNEIERLVADVWCEVLHLPSVDAHDNFFDLGGHSLLVVQIHQRLTRALQRRFPITDLFRFPTVQTIAAHLSRDPAGARASTLTAASTVPARDDVAQRAELRKTAALRRVRPR